MAGKTPVPRLASRLAGGKGCYRHESRGRPLNVASLHSHGRRRRVVKCKSPTRSGTLPLIRLEYASSKAAVNFECSVGQRRWLISVAPTIWANSAYTDFGTLEREAGERMPDTLLDNIIFLLRYRRSMEKATKLFTNWKHNSDILPKMQGQLEVLRDARGKFQAVVYDIQGIHDEGSDIVIRYHIDDKPDDLICFQVKSFDDLAKKDYLQGLKPQRDDTFRSGRQPQHYFIVLCTDSVAHKSKIREIMAAFKNAERTEVIEPAYAFTFLHHPKARIEAYVKRSLEIEDIVLKLALESIEIPSPSARALVIYMTVKSVLTGKRSFGR